MEFTRKKMQLKFEGANPMEIIVEGEDLPSVSGSEGRRAFASAVGASVKQYLESAESLIAGKYAHLRDSAPEYLAKRGPALVMICDDGIVVRYERKTAEEDPKIAVTVSDLTIVQAAASLSQNVVHIETLGVPNPTIENFGSEIRLQKGTVGTQERQDFLVMRIWFLVMPAEAPSDQKPGPKPYCLLSARNELQLEFHGVTPSHQGKEPNMQPFIARTAMPLGVGWDCIEVFPGLREDMWNADFAPLWAEMDLQGAALIAHARDAHLNSLDPRASARQMYANLLAEFKALLDSNPDREELLQAFLKRQPILLHPTHAAMWPKLPIGAKVTDFVFRDANFEYLLVELERSTHELFRSSDGHVAAELTTALGQIVDWKRYLADNLHTVQKELGLTGITPNPNGLVVIGRSASLTEENRRKLQTMASESPKIRIMTYDDVYHNARAMIENMLGPIWDTGGNTQVFFPSAASASGPAAGD